MSFDEADEVTLPRSPRSTSRTLRPRPAASRAIPVPLIPPPMTSRSTMGGDYSPCTPPAGPGAGGRKSLAARLFQVIDLEDFDARHSAGLRVALRARLLAVLDLLLAADL